ncbi:MAG: DUF2065 domain-containing protein [Rhodocyclaceae bacterium]|nr:DUF2065 domain-containing protein [Rhodocyclaceae bacterium]MCB2030289.1 DUF2065 domain-containing protein [Rhodoferax sp.]
MAATLITALALMLVLEGILPLVAPTLWRDTFKRVIELADGQIRFLGLTMVLIGLLLLSLLG